MSRIPPKPEAREGNVQRRVVGSAPELGKMGRMAAESKRRRKSKPGSRSSSRRRSRTSKVLTNWLVLLLSIVGITFVCVLFWSAFDMKDPIPPPVSQTIIVPDLPSDRAIEIVENMLAAESAEQLEAIIRPGHLSAKEALNYLKNLQEESDTPPTPLWVGTVDSLSVPIEFVSVRYSDTVVRSVFFTLNDQDEWKVDFDAFVELCVPEFRSLLDGKEDEGLVRVHITKDNYFNSSFGDEADWDSYLLTKPGEDTSLYGYCRRGSKAHAAMEALNKRVVYHTAQVTDESIQESVARRPSASRATLYIKHPPEADTRQFEITSVVSDEWVISDKPFDERLAEKMSLQIEE